jgi:hypothetical protein
MMFSLVLERCSVADKDKYTSIGSRCTPQMPQNFNELRGVVALRQAMRPGTLRGAAAAVESAGLVSSEDERLLVADACLRIGVRSWDELHSAVADRTLGEALCHWN